MKLISNALLFKRNYNTTFCCLPEVKLMGRKIISPESMSHMEIESIMWSALEMREMYEEAGLYINSPISNSNVTFLMTKPNAIIEALVKNAAYIMGVRLNTIVDKKWEEGNRLCDYGRFFCKNCELVLCYSGTCGRLYQFIKGLDYIPFLSIESRKYSIPRAIGDMMSIYLKYGYLKDIDLAWLGAPTRLLNTYMVVLPTLGINIKYCSSCEVANREAPKSWTYGQMLRHSKIQKLEVFEDVKEMLRKSMVLAVSSQCTKEMRLTHALANELLNPNWTFLHSLPRGENDVDEEMIESGRNLIWSCINSHKWVICAFMLRLLTPHEHVTCPPTFQNCPIPKHLLPENENNN